MTETYINQYGQTVTKIIIPTGLSKKERREFLDRKLHLNSNTQYFGWSMSHNIIDDSFNR